MHPFAKRYRENLNRMFKYVQKKYSIPRSFKKIAPNRFLFQLLVHMNPRLNKPIGAIILTDDLPILNPISPCKFKKVFLEQHFRITTSNERFNRKQAGKNRIQYQVFQIYTVNLFLQF